VRLADQIGHVPSLLHLQLDKWAQCGGKSGGGADAAIAGACCPVNYQCTRSSEWYWQCVPYQEPVIYYTECPGKTEVRPRSGAGAWGRIDYCTTAFVRRMLVPG
jgi:hypothetical protein